MLKIYGIIRHRIKTDGEGITSLVGLSGCPLNCKYCLDAKVIKQNKCYEKTEEELLQELIQDACYFIATNGGVTFGGAEPLLQSQGLVNFAKIKPDWMKMNIETSLQVPNDAVTELLPYINEWIVDIKTLDPSLYLQYTGKPIAQMLYNLEFMAKNASDKCKIRIPVIPEFKSQKQAEEEAEIIRNLGFNKIDIFEYIVKETL